MEFHSLVVKSIALLVTAISVHVSLSPPNPPVKRNECTGSRTHTFFERLIQWITFTSKTMVWLGALWDLTMSLTAFWAYHNVSPSSSAATSVNYTVPMHPRLSSHPPPALWAVHPAMLLGAIATASAAILRIWCFKTLGPLFTFEVSIRPQHELVTHGPYGWVRHPSYVGVYLTLLGATAALCAPGSWLSSGGGWLTPVGLTMVTLWTIKCLYVFRGTSLRLHAEDEILKANFGPKWEEYAKKVPYKLVPFLL